MTKTNKRILTRMTAILLAVIALFSVFSGLSVRAKAGDKVTVTFGYCYDTGGSIIKFAKKVTNGGITVGTAGEALCKIFANKKEAYCIQPGVDLHSGNQLTESGSTVWKKLGTAKQKSINLALLYGKGGNAKNLSGTADQKWVATQLIIWEFVAGCRKTSDVVYAFIAKGMIYESEKYHNVVFVGKNKDNIPRHAHTRATSTEKPFKHTISSSNPKYSFHWTNPNSDKLYFFEAPIDMLSFISMNKWNWQLNSYAAACSVSDKVLFQCLKDNPKIKTVYLCLDNDEAGKKANKRIAEKLKELNVNYKILVPTHKDWNEDLLCEGDEDLCQDFKL